jgi:hypothetical protein
VVHAVAFPLLVDPYGYSVPANLWEDLRHAAQEKLEQTRKAIEARVSGHGAGRRSRDPVASIADAVRAHGADLVVMGTHGRGGLSRVPRERGRARAAYWMPILAVKEDAETAAKPIAKIVLAVDFSPHSIAPGGSRARRTALGFVDVIHALDLPVDFAPYLSRRVKLERRSRRTSQERLEDPRAAQRQIQ